MASSILIVVGEISGDLLAANLVDKFPDEARFFGITGENLRAQGVESIKELHDMGGFGFSNVILQVPRMLRLKRELMREVRERETDCAILVDYPGFNLRLAKDLHKAGIMVIYYVSPQIWAWHFCRIKKIKKYVDFIVPILPFEQNIYTNYGVNAEFFGHPFTEIVRPELSEEKFCAKYSIEAPFLTIMPGSRLSEIKRILPPMLAAIKNFQHDIGHTPVLLPLAPSIEQAIIDDILATSERQFVKVIRDDRCSALKYAKLALVTSGSATLETAILETPMVVLYKTDFISWWVIRLISKVKFASLVNIILKEAAVPELLQSKCTQETIYEQLQSLWNSSELRNIQKRKLKLLKNKLGDERATAKAAEKIRTLCEKIKVK